MVRGRAGGAEGGVDLLPDDDALLQELTTLASDQLSVRALRMETARLQTLILELQAEEESLRAGLEGGPAVDEASVAALLAQARAVQR